MSQGIVDATNLGGRRGKVLLKLELERLGVLHKHSSTYHPQTCGKVERLHQTLQKFLAKQPPSASLIYLQRQLDSFRDYYNQRRPHRALDRQTPAAVFQRPPHGTTCRATRHSRSPRPP